MAKVLVRFVSPRFKIEEATVSLFNTNAIYQDWTKFAEAFSVYPLQSDTAEIEVGSPGLIEGSLINIVLRRSADGSLYRINFCRFNEEIRDSALRSGKLKLRTMKWSRESSSLRQGHKKIPTPLFSHAQSAQSSRAAALPAGFLFNLNW